MTFGAFPAPISLTGGGGIARFLPPGLDYQGDISSGIWAGAEWPGESAVIPVSTQMLVLVSWGEGFLP